MNKPNRGSRLDTIQEYHEAHKAFWSAARQEFMQSANRAIEYETPFIPWTLELLKARALRHFEPDYIYQYIGPTGCPACKYVMDSSVGKSMAQFTECVKQCPIDWKQLSIEPIKCGACIVLEASPYGMLVDKLVYCEGHTITKDDVYEIERILLDLENIPWITDKLSERSTV